MDKRAHYCRAGAHLAPLLHWVSNHSAFTMRYRTTIDSQVFDFDDLKQVMAFASPARSGDYLAEIGAATAQQRMAARYVLAETPLKQFLTEALVPYESDT